MRFIHDRNAILMVASLFTLIELMVVVAIIAILAALLLPALNQARATVLRVKCMSNQKQIATAIAGYASDNADYIPLTMPLGESPVGSRDPFKPLWYIRLAPYVGMKELDSEYFVRNSPPGHVFHCPEQLKQITRLAESSSLVVNKVQYSGSSYSIPLATLNNSKSAYTLPIRSGFRVGQVGAPSGRMLVSDVNPIYAVFGYVMSFPADDYSTFLERSRLDYFNSATMPPFSASHGGRGNILFYDGHVESATPQEVWYKRDLTQEDSYFNFK